MKWAERRKKQAIEIGEKYHSFDKIIVTWFFFHLIKSIKLIIREKVFLSVMCLCIVKFPVYLNGEFGTASTTTTSSSSKNEM